MNKILKIKLFLGDLTVSELKIATLVTETKKVHPLGSMKMLSKFHND